MRKTKKPKQMHGAAQKAKIPNPIHPKIGDVIKVESIYMAPEL